MLSVGDWRYTKDFEMTLFDDNNEQIGTGTLYLKDFKVGDNHRNSHLMLKLITRL